MQINMDKLDLFPVPLLGTEFPSADILADVLVPKMKDIESKDQNPIPYSANSYTNYNAYTQALDMEECKELKSFIEECGKSANKLIGIDGGIMFTGSWFSITRQFGVHPEHNHIPATWSGVYYVQANENDSPITFLDSNKNSNWPWMQTNQANSYNTPSYSIKPKTGRLILFPSWLMHRVDQQMADQERVTISFNLAALHEQK